MAQTPDRARRLGPVRSEQACHCSVACSLGKSPRGLALEVVLLEARCSARSVEKGFHSGSMAALRGVVERRPGGAVESCRSGPCGEEYLDNRGVAHQARPV
jgi:hypothetical protein